MSHRVTHGTYMLVQAIKSPERSLYYQFQGFYLYEVNVYDLTGRSFNTDL